MSLHELRAALAGFFVASILPALVLGIGWPLSGDLNLKSSAVTTLVTLPFTSLFVLLLGVPAFLILRQFRPGAWWSVALVGLILGVVTAYLLRLPGVPSFETVMLDGLLGVLSALSFWLIWKSSLA